MRYSPNQAEHIWKIIEEGLEEFKKKSAPSASVQHPESSTTEPCNESVDESKKNGTENEHENVSKGIANNEIESIIEHALAQSELGKSTKKVLKRLLKHTDIPLNVQSPKKKKLIKFLQEQFGLNEETSNAVWISLSQSIHAILSEANGVSNDLNGISGIKRKHVDSSEEVASKKSKTEVIMADSTTDANGESTFDWQKHILRVFKKYKKNNQLPVDSLKLKVIKRFLKTVGENESNGAKYEKKFKKFLKKINELSIANGMVLQLKE